MFSTNDKISMRQFQILFILIMFSSVSLVLPQIASKFGQQNGWMLVIGAIFLNSGYGYLIATLGKLFPNETIVEYSKMILTKPIGILISLIFLIKGLFLNALHLRIFGELVKQTLLKRTPIEIIIISMLFVAVYLARKGYESRARLGEIIIFIALIPILLILAFAIPDIKTSNLAPVFTIGAKDFFYGVYMISIMASGVEFLYVAMPFLKSPGKVIKPMFQSIIFTGLLLTMICIVTIGVFGAAETERQIWPVMTIMQVVELPGAFIERQDALMMSFWIMSVFTHVNAFVFFASIIVSRIINTEKFYYFQLILVPIVYFIALIPNNVPETFEMFEKVVVYLGVLFLLLIPLLLLAVAKIRKLGVKSEKKTS